MQYNSYTEFLNRVSYNACYDLVEDGEFFRQSRWTRDGDRRWSCAGVFVVHAEENEESMDRVHDSATLEVRCSGKMVHCNENVCRSPVGCGWEDKYVSF